MTADGEPESGMPGIGAQVEVRVAAGGVPTAEQEAALVIAVNRVIAQRDLAREAPEPLWGAVGRFEASVGLSIRSRATLPGSIARSRVVGAPE